MLMAHRIKIGFSIYSNHSLKSAQQMGIKEDWQDIGNILGIDKDNHHIFIRHCTRTIRCAFLSNITFLNSTPVTKSIRTSNPIQRIVAVD
jgi:hypothetical protein